MTASDAMRTPGIGSAANPPIPLRINQIASSSIPASVSVSQRGRQRKGWNLESL